LKPKFILALVAVVVLGVALLLPLSNLMSPRTILQSESKDPEFAALSSMLQNKCADCHSPGLAHFPIYTNLPIARQMIDKDIADAQSSFVISPEQLKGTVPLGGPALARMRSEIAGRSMPPARYLMMHWQAGITDAEQQSALVFIDRKKSELAIKPIPAKNPFNLDSRKVALGEKLYFDKRLSADNSLSCSSCHDQNKGGTDGQKFADGINNQIGPINVPTAFNAAFNFVEFWDGRAADLKAQAAGPVNNPKEMGSNWKQVLSKLEKDEAYVRAFKELYPQGMSGDSITDAIAAFECTLLTPNSRFDRFLGGDKNALTADEKDGYKLFQDRNCADCHAGVNMGGMSFEKMGVRKDYFKQRGNLTEADNGRFNVTHQEYDRHKFKVPTLRNIALTAPYFHDGSTDDLSAAVKIMAEYQTRYPVSDKEAGLIAAFLQTTTGQYKGKLLERK
jgi:cytochrome c peroxidase